MSIYLPGDETFAGYMRAVAGSTIELEVVTGRVTTGRLVGVGETWVLLIDTEKKHTIVQMVHVASIRVLDWKQSSEVT